MTQDAKYAQFYESVDREALYFSDDYDALIESFAQRYNLRNAKVLEVGSGRGQFQNFSTDYTGVDIAENLRPYYHPPAKYVLIEDGKPFPFPTDHFDAAMTFATFEHIPSLENAFRELLRVVKPGGHILFHAAWQVRPWAARGLSVRPFRELSWRDRLEKLTVPIRNSVFWRSLFVFPKRLWRALDLSLRSPGPDYPMRNRLLVPNYQDYWQTDADACNHMDIHDAILWFQARGCTVDGYPTPFHALKARNGGFFVEVKKTHH